MAVNLWIKKNCVESEEIKVVLSQRWRDPETGKPLEWTLKPLTAKETDEIQRECMESRYDPRTNSTVRELNSINYINALAAKTIIDPDLSNKETQESMGTTGSMVDTMNAMLEPAEKDELILKINEIYKLNRDLIREAADDAKNE